MLEHYSLLYHKVGFLLAKHQLFPDADLQDLGQVSKTTLKIISKDEKVVHEKFQVVAKKVGEDCHHASLKCHRGIAQSE